MMSKKRLPTSCSLQCTTGLWTIKQAVAIKPDKLAVWECMTVTQDSSGGQKEGTPPDPGAI